MTPQFVQDLQEKYGKTDIEIHIHKGIRRDILSDEQFWQIIGLLDWTKLGDNEAVVDPDAYLLKTGKQFEYVPTFSIETYSNKQSWV